MTDLPILSVQDVGTSAEVRMAKVLRLRSEIIAGTYHVPLEQLAEKMLDRARRQRQAIKNRYRF